MKFSMRNLGLLSGLTALSLMGLVSGVKAQTTTTGSTSLQVVINQRCSFVGSLPSYGSQSVNSSSEITVGLLGSTVQNINLTCNHANGFTLSARSANGGSLKNGNNAIDYKVTTTNVDVDIAVTNTKNTFTLPSTDTVVAETSAFSPKCATSGTNNGCNVGFSLALVPPTAGLPAGTYTDTITYTLAGK